MQEANRREHFRSHVSQRNEDDETYFRIRLSTNFLVYREIQDHCVSSYRNVVERRSEKKKIFINRLSNRVDKSQIEKK